MPDALGGTSLSRDVDHSAMTRLLICLLAVLSVQRFCFADVTKLSAERLKALRDFDRYREISAATNLPPPIYALCADDKGRIADPGRKWNSTDVSVDEKLPRKRLIWAVLNGPYYVVHYERGGIDHSFHILVAKLAKNDAKPKVVWHAVGKQLKDYAAFTDALRSGKLDDRVNYPH